jgi:hypothetical protein
MTTTFSKRSPGGLVRAIVLAGAGLVGLQGCTGMVEGGGAGAPAPGGGSNPSQGGTGNGGGSMPGGSNPGGGGSNPGNTGNGSGMPGGGGGNPPGGGGVVEPPLPTAQVSCPNDGKDTIGRRALRRLTVAELETTIRTAFGLDATQWAGPTVPPDPSSLDGFTNNVDRLTVGPEYARGVLDTGRTVAKLVATDPLITKLLPCHSSNGGQGSAMAPCAQTFVTTFGPKLYRRPLTPAEVQRYMDLFEKSGKADFKTFVHWATLTMLQSPRVLYRSELGTADGTSGRFKLSAYEVASALSYTFTGGPPTTELMQLAATDKLQTADQVEQAARALVLDSAGKVKPAFATIMLHFADDWLGLSSLSNLKKDDTAFPTYSADVQAAMGEESRRFLQNVLLEEKGTASSLLTANYTFVDAKLAQYYGYPAPPTAAFTKVNRPAEWGVGLLSQGALLSVESHSKSTSPTKRGYFVRTRLLCHAVPPPPPVVGDLPPPTEGETTRQRYETLHAGDPACKGCHQLFDPIGFAFEHLDATGKYRAKEGKFDIDDSGSVTATTQGDLPFRGPTELANKLANLPEVSSCVASFMAAYAFGVSQENASCLVRSATLELQKGRSFLDFYLSLARADHFRLRQQ